MWKRRLDHPKGKGTRNPDQPRKERMKIQSNQGREVYFPIQDQPEEERAKPNQPKDKEDFWSAQGSEGVSWINQEQWI